MGTKVAVTSTPRARAQKICKTKNHGKNEVSGIVPVPMHERSVLALFCEDVLVPYMRAKHCLYVWLYRALCAPFCCIFVWLYRALSL